MRESREMMAVSPRRPVLSRRAFVQGTAALVAGGMLWSTVRSARTDHAAAPEFPLHAPDQAAFAASVGETFRIDDRSGQPLDVQLIAVADRRPPVSADHHGGESFALIFRGPGDRALAQDTYPFAHPRLGVFPLFIVPGIPGPDGITHEAVINRLPDGKY